MLAHSYTQLKLQMERIAVFGVALAKLPVTSAHLSVWALRWLSGTNHSEPYDINTMEYRYSPLAVTLGIRLLLRSCVPGDGGFLF